MAMNENEGSSAYPPNPDVKSGSCLIAGFHALTDIRPSYWNAYKAESGARIPMTSPMGIRYPIPIPTVICGVVRMGALIIFR